MIKLEVFTIFCVFCQNAQHKTGISTKKPIPAEAGIGF
jgi:hypothetical protein